MLERKHSAAGHSTAPQGRAKGTATNGTALLSDSWAELSWQFIFVIQQCAVVVSTNKPGGVLIVVPVPGMI